LTMVENWSHLALVSLLDLVKQSGYRNARKLMTTWRLLCKEAGLSEDVFTSLTRFVCSAYCPSDINISNILELRWHLFCKNMAEYDRLHPTVGALRQHIMRVHIQAYVWGQAAISHHADISIKTWLPQGQLVTWSTQTDYH